jgi:ABC-type nickel/cobalt efflux system permease component RcnA
MPTETVASAEPRTPQTRLWLGVLIAAAAWAFQGLACVVIASVACSTSNAGSGTPDTVRLVLGIVTAISLIVAIAGAIISWRNWHRFSRTEVMHAEAVGVEQFLSLAGLFISTALIAGLVWAGLPVVMIGVCVVER